MNRKYIYISEGKKLLAFFEILLTDKDTPTWKKALVIKHGSLSSVRGRTDPSPFLKMLSVPLSTKTAFSHHKNISDS